MPTPRFHAAPPRRTVTPLVLAIMALASLVALPASALGGARQADADQLRIVLDSLRGKWEGAYEGHTFRTQTRSNGKLRMEVEISMTAPTAIRSMRFESNGTVIRAQEVLAFDDDGMRSTPIGRSMEEGGDDSRRAAITSLVVKNPRTWTLVAERGGQVADREARVRVTMSLEGGVLRSLREVDFLDEAGSMPDGTNLEIWEFASKSELRRIEYTPQQLVGAWRVDLGAEPNDDPRPAELRITSAGGGLLTGSFNGMTIEQGHVNAAWDGVRFAFVLRDGRSMYNTSGVLRGGRIEGVTHSVSAGSVTVWRGR